MKFLKKSLFTIINAPDQRKTKQMLEKVISKTPGMLQFIPNHYYTQKKVQKKQMIIIVLMHSNMFLIVT